MIEVYALNVSALDPDDPAALSLIGGERASAAAGFARRIDRALCVGAGLLLCAAVRACDSGASLPPALRRNAFGKPFAPALEGFHFNLSHSGEWAVAAFGGRELGVDIQRMRPVSPELYLRYFKKEECEYIASRGEPCRTAAFFELWTLKESYLKAAGLGLTLALNAFRVEIGPPVLLAREGKHPPCALALCDFPDPAYRLALAAIGEEPVDHRLCVLTADEVLAAILQ